MQPARRLRFHWSPCRDDSASDSLPFIAMCQDAEEAGLESVHVPIGSCLSNALELAKAAGTESVHVKFRVGWDFAGVLTTLFGRELKKASEILGDRIIVHMCFRGEQAVDASTHAAAEFIASCRDLFANAAGPRFDVEGQTSEAAFLAIKRASCLWRLPHRPNQIYADALPLLHFGKELGLLCYVIARDAREHALTDATRLLPRHAVAQLDDLASWTTPYLWTGMLDEKGEEGAILVGSFEEVARALHGFKESGITQCMIRDWPGQQEMMRFGTKVLPLVRALELERAGSS